ncbi:MAG TPA: dienelactone hydrolase family protein [Myxococcaceae bacterium]|nr:dienelactone hydrolase family protein [Myxococcaceae bacterium]
MDDDLRSFIVPRIPLTRREFVVTAIGAGFALAVQPVYGEAIKTDSSGLVAGEVKIPVADGEVPAYRAMPVTGKNFPTVLVVQEIFGVHEYIQDVCRRFAKLGYFAVAPALFARQGDVSKISEMSEIMKVVSRVPDAQVMSDLDAAVDWASKSGKANTAKLGITGFCWGGRIVWLYAAHSPKLKAGVAWYGRLVGERDPLHPKYPIDVVSELKAPVLGLYGEKDNGIPLDTIEQMRKAVKAAGKIAEIVVFPDAGHAFHADYRPSYRAEQAAEGWKRLLAWFKKYGVA